MCRISGIIDRTQEIASLRNEVETMSKTLRRGGPDDEGIYVNEEEKLVFGHRRLSLIDLSPLGHQPMSYQSSRFYITYNGELYNYKQLKEQLAALGHTFHTRSDTEVVLASFAQWGIKAFERFNGMFAFALWDNLNKKVYLVRDGSGIKPLYYSITNKRLVFASEVRAFKSIGVKEKDTNAEIYLMAYGHIPEPTTTLKGVSMLPKGSVLTFDANSGDWKINSYTHYSYLEKISDKETAKNLIRETFQLAIERHLISDAAIGVFLSGGLDSSIIASLANKQNKKGLNTLSIYFDEHEYSEKKYQDILINELSCNHSQFLLKEDDFRKYLPTIIEDMDLPSCDGINTWFISKFAKESGLKAVLSGIGGDEIFGGYPSFDRMKLLYFLNLSPKVLLRAGRFSTNKKARRLGYLTIDGSKGKYLFLRGQFIPNEIAKYLGANESEVWNILDSQPELPDINYLSTPNQASWLEMNLYMQNQLLRDADVMSMNHGIEIRVPFLDKEFLELSLQISSHLKYHGQHPKQLLIDTFKDIIPRQIWDRPKMGFSFPFKEWMMKNTFVKEQLNGNSRSSSHYYKFTEGKLHWSQLMTLLVAKEQSNA